MNENVLFLPNLEVREEGGDQVLEGLACPFYDGDIRTQYDMPESGLIERFAKGAFDKWLGQNPAIEARVNHDPAKTFAVSPETLTLWTDKQGLKYRAKLPMDVSWVRDMVALVRRGVIRGSSIRFAPVAKTWSREGTNDICTIREAVIEEVSPVYRPAYKASQALLRSRDEYIASLALEPYEKRLAEILHSI